MNIKKYLKILGFSTIFICVIFIFIFFYALYPIKYKKEIQLYSNNHMINPAIIASIICIESSFNKNAVSPKGAMGLMQLMPDTAKWICDKINVEYNKELLFDVSYNIKLGSYYFSYLTNKFNNLDTAIVAYNAGEGNVVSWLNNPQYSKDKKTLYKIPYKESENYLKRINLAKKVYELRI